MFLTILINLEMATNQSSKEFQLVNENKAKIPILMRSYHRLTIREIVDELKLSCYAVQRILNEYLHMYPAFEKGFL